jgi:hypothetical protein
MPASWNAASDGELTAVEEAIKDGCKRCCVCKVPKPEGQRCKGCKGLATRISAVIQKQGIVDSWDFASEDQKAAFYQTHLGARGPALATAVQLHVEERKRARNVVEVKQRKRARNAAYRAARRLWKLQSANVLARQSLEKQVGNMNDMMVTICAAAGVEA